jgi:hypothetical protein
MSNSRLAIASKVNQIPEEQRVTSVITLQYTATMSQLIRD